MYFHKSWIQVQAVEPVSAEVQSGPHWGGGTVTGEQADCAASKPNSLASWSFHKLPRVLQFIPFLFKLPRPAFIF